MKKIFSKTAVTLIELIVSLMLVSVIVLGIFAINVVLNNNNQDYGQRYLVKSETQITLNHILNDASLAVGSVTRDSYGNLDTGIITGLRPYGNNREFCIHQKPASGDTWVCYTFDLTSGDVNYQQITYCNNTFNPSVSNRGAGSGCNNTPQFLGTAYNITNPVNNGTDPYYDPLNSPTIGFSITIQNCLNDAASSCFSANPDPVNNPQVTVTGNVVPAQESTG